MFTERESEDRFEGRASFTQQNSKRKDDEVGTPRTPDDRDRLPGGGIGDPGKTDTGSQPPLKMKKRQDHDDQEVEDPKVERDRDRAPGDRIQDGTPREKMWASPEHSRSKASRTGDKLPPDSQFEAENRSGDSTKHNPTGSSEHGGVPSADPVKARRK